VAEESGMIVPLGDWVLGQTMALLAQWQREGLEDLRLAVNLSARQFSGGTCSRASMNWWPSTGSTLR
jgi:EAL domain-containing protein (putative c-di-GMP-specific phosphodiesterase class I)